MLAAAARLGDAIGKSWHAHGFDEAAFPEIATSAMQSDAGVAELRGSDLVAWLVETRSVPPQAYTGFGQPSVVLYRDFKFLIEALFWFDGSTTIHQHAFSGAFMVLHGSSLHTTYRFDLDDRVCRQLLLGTLSCESCERLRVGDVRTILAGTGLVHSVAHVERPSITLVARTLDEPSTGPQYSYVRPGVAIDPRFEPEPQMTRIRALNAMFELDQDGFWPLLSRTLANSDPWFAFRLLCGLVPAVHQHAQWHDRAAILHDRHGARAARLIAAAKQWHDDAELADLRAAMTGTSERLLLALLTHAPSRTRVIRAFEAEYGGSAIEAIVDLVAGLAKAGRAPLRFDAATRAVLRAGLRGGTLGDVEATLARVTPGWQGEHADALHRLWKDLRTLPVLTSVWPRTRQAKGDST